MDRTGEGLQSAQARRRRGQGPRLREASFQDHQQIARLESRYGLAAIRSYEEWSHLWLGNPVYRALQPDWSIGWVLEDDNHRIVGSMGNIPLWYEFQGRRVLAASGHSWVAEPEYRSASLLLLDHVINQRHVDLYVNNSVDVASTAAVEAFQCPRVPVGIWDKAAFWITHHRGFAQSVLTRRNYRLAKPLSYPLSAALLLREGLTRNGADAGEVDIRPRAGFDERFDEFWTDVKQGNPHLLWAVRTREVLEWHYRYALLHRRLWIVVVMDGSRMVAYAVFDRRDNEFGLKRVRLVDFQSLDGSTALLTPVLSWALRRCRAEGIHMLESVGRWLEKGELLEAIAPYQRRLPTWRFFYRANQAELAKRLSEGRVWAPSLFDGDASLMR